LGADFLNLYMERPKIISELILLYMQSESLTFYMSLLSFWKKRNTRGWEVGASAYEYCSPHATLTALKPE
jgi:hypothetical protein